MPHRIIPDFRTDGPYLDLLGKSAAAGYAPALAKLGEHAMRRAAWVEAYYRMSMAKWQGMQGLTIDSSRLKPVPSAGHSFTSISATKAAKAREFLKANHPEFLTCR